MLKSFLTEFGKAKLNTFTKYPSILTLHKLGDRGMLLNDLTTPIDSNDVFTATEKIDGTNVRIIVFGGEYIIGSRENLLHISGDIFYDPAQEIVESFYKMALNLPLRNKIFHKNIHVIYGELFGGKISSNSKWYGTSDVSFRVFDITKYNEDEIRNVMQLPIEQISTWRERETENGIIYGQKFLTKAEMKENYDFFNYVPDVYFELGDMSHVTILENLNKFIPTTHVALTDTAVKKTEGVVIRNIDRTKILKLRFEDYMRTLKKK